MVVEPFTLFGLFSMTIILGYLGNWFFGKTRIPDVIWLLLFGILIGPVLGAVDPQLFVTLVPFMVPLALLIILFDAGLHMDFYAMLRALPRGLVLAVLNVAVCMGSIAVLLMFLLEFDLVQGLLMGAIVGGTATSIVIGITQALKLRREVRDMLNLDSIITTPLCIVLAIALVEIIAGLAEVTLESAVRSVFSEFSVAIVLGMVGGILWMFALHYLRGRPFDYMLTLAMVFSMYILTEGVGGDGSVASLIFGLVLANATTFSRMLRLKKILIIGREAMKRFHDEITFFIRSFFFVFMGIIITLDPSLLLYGLAVTAVLILARMVVTHVAMVGMGLPRADVSTVKVMAPRGEGAAVLAQLPLVYGIAQAHIFSSLAFITILASVAYTTMCIAIIHRKIKKS